MYIHMCSMCMCEGIGVWYMCVYMVYTCVCVFMCVICACMSMYECMLVGLQVCAHMYT